MFTCKHRITFQALLLGAFDFGIPVGTLDQAHRDYATDISRQTLQPANYDYRAPLVGLYRKAISVPTGKFSRSVNKFEYFERQ